MARARARFEDMEPLERMGRGDRVLFYVDTTKLQNGRPLKIIFNFFERNTGSPPGGRYQYPAYDNKGSIEPTAAFNAQVMAIREFVQAWEANNGRTKDVYKFPGEEEVYRGTDRRVDFPISDTRTPVPPRTRYAVDLEWVDSASAGNRASHPTAIFVHAPYHDSFQDEYTHITVSAANDYTRTGFCGVFHLYMTNGTGRYQGFRYCTFTRRSLRPEPEDGQDRGVWRRTMENFQRALTHRRIYPEIHPVTLHHDEDPRPRPGPGPGPAPGQNPGQNPGQGPNGGGTDGNAGNDQAGGPPARPNAWFPSGGARVVAALDRAAGRAHKKGKELGAISVTSLIAFALLLRELGALDANTMDVLDAHGARRYGIVGYNDLNSSRLLLVEPSKIRNVGGTFDTPTLAPDVSGIAFAIRLSLLLWFSGVALFWYQAAPRKRVEDEWADPRMTNGDVVDPMM